MIFIVIYYWYGENIKLIYINVFGFDFDFELMCFFNKFNHGLSFLSSSVLGSGKSGGKFRFGLSIDTLIFKGVILICSNSHA